MISGQQQKFVNQSKILRRNLFEWDNVLRSPQGEDWPSMLGRLNAAMNQLVTLDRSIDPSLDHFVYQPRKSPVNAQDIPFFLSTRLIDERGAAIDNNDDNDVSADDGVNSSSNNSTSKEDGTKKRSNNDMSEGKDDRKHVAKKRKRADGMNAAAVLRNYESLTADFANSFEERIVRF